MIARAWFFFVFLVGLSSVAAAAETRPNIVLFLADDLSWSDCSIYNSKSGIETPNIERLAEKGMTFTQAFVASPSCAPSRAALLTGLNPIRNGAMFNHTLPDREHKRWPAWFQELGYEVVAFGKVAHYATVKQYGFDHVDRFGYHEDDCVEKAIEWLKQRKSEKPLCLLVGTNWPHVPWPAESSYDPARIELPPTQVDTEQTRRWRARYAAAVSKADRDLGLLFDAAQQHLGKDYFFLYSSDHGSQFPFGKWNCYDAGIRTPLIAVWPEHVKDGATSDALVSWVDLLPTCLAVAGAKPPPSGAKPGELSGRSFLPVIVGDATEHRQRIFTTHSGDGKMNHYPMRSVRSRKWKYIRNLSPEAEFHSHVDLAQGEDGKGYWDSWEKAAENNQRAAAVVQRYHRRPAEELYDLEQDPHEQTNLAESPDHGETLLAFREELNRWMKQQGDQGLATEQRRKPKAK